jgi:hypothetical protein
MIRKPKIDRIKLLKDLKRLEASNKAAQKRRDAEIDYQDYQKEKGE